MELSIPHIIQKTRAYLAVMLVFWIFSGIMLAVFGYVESFKLLNAASHNPLSDFLGLYLTHLADAILLPLLLLLFAWRQDRALPLTALLLMALTGLTTQLLKNFLFDDWLRPPALYGDDPNVIILPQNPPRHHSFPSGHATTFAAGGLAFAWLFREAKIWWQFGIGLITVALCYTRVHIGVHFLGDIMVGSMIGTLGSLLVMGPIHRFNQRLFARIPESRWNSIGIYVLVIAAILFILRYLQYIFF